MPLWNIAAQICPALELMKSCFFFFFTNRWASVMLRLNMWFIFHGEHNSPLRAKQNMSWGQLNTATLCTCLSGNVVIGVATLAFSLLFWLKDLCWSEGRAGRTIRAPFLSSWCFCFAGWLGEGLFISLRRWLSGRRGETSGAGWPSRSRLMPAHRARGGCPLPAETALV